MSSPRPPSPDDSSESELESSDANLHDFLITIGVSLGYQLDKEGICQGVALMAIQALVGGKINEFNDRLEKLTASYLEFIQNINIDSDSSGDSASSSSESDSDNEASDNESDSDNSSDSYSEIDFDDENTLERLHQFGDAFLKSLSSELRINLRAFYDGIALYANPQKYALDPEHAGLFEEKVKHQVDFAPVTSMVAPLTIPGGIHQHPRFINAFTKNELRQFLEEIHSDAMSLVDKPTALLIGGTIHEGAGAHAISVGYDPGNKTWYFIDANQLPIEQCSDISDIARKIYDIFHYKKHVIISIQPFDSLNDYDFSNSIKNLRKQMLDSIFQNSGKLKLLDAVGSNLLKTAIQNKDREYIDACIAASVDFNIKTNAGALIDNFVTAACMDDIKTCKELLNHGYNPFEVKAGSSVSAFSFTAFHGKPEIIESILQLSKNLKEYNEAIEKLGVSLIFTLNTPLDHPSKDQIERLGILKILKMLIYYGADINEIRSKIHSPLSRNMIKELKNIDEECKKDMIQNQRQRIIRDASKKSGPDLYAITVNDREYHLSIANKAKWDISERAINGDYTYKQAFDMLYNITVLSDFYKHIDLSLPALGQAVYFADAALTRSLLEQGDNPNYLFNKEITPLLLAVSNCLILRKYPKIASSSPIYKMYDKVIEILIEYGADIYFGNDFEKIKKQAPYYAIQLQLLDEDCAKKSLASIKDYIETTSWKLNGIQLFGKSTTGKEIILKNNVKIFVPTTVKKQWDIICQAEKREISARNAMNEIRQLASDAPENTFTRDRSTGEYYQFFKTARGNHGVEEGLASLKNKGNKH